jgi:hypothetical protein
MSTPTTVAAILLHANPQGESNGHGGSDVRETVMVREGTLIMSKSDGYGVKEAVMMST